MQAIALLFRRLYRWFCTALSLLAPILQAAVLLLLTLFGVSAAMADVLFLNRSYYVAYLLLFAALAGMLVFQSRYERRHIVLSQWKELKTGAIPSVWKDIRRLVRDRYFVSFFGVTLSLSLALSPFYIPLEAAVLGLQDSPIPAWRLTFNYLVHMGFPAEQMAVAPWLPTMGQHVLLIVLPNVLIVTATFLLMRRYCYRTLRDNEPILLEQEKTTSLPVRIVSTVGWLCVPLFGLPVLGVAAAVTVSLLSVLYAYAPLMLATVLIIVLLFWLVGACRRVRIRRKFLREFSRVCRQNGLTPQWQARPLLSVFRPFRPGLSLVLPTPRCVYAVKLVAAKRPLLPMLIEPDGDIVIQREARLSPRAMRGGMRGVHMPASSTSLFNWGLRYHLGFDTTALEQQYGDPYADEQRPVVRVLLVNPAPRQVRFGYDYDYKPVDNGDKVGDMMLWSGSGFCRHVELSLRDEA